MGGRRRRRSRKRRGQQSLRLQQQTEKRRRSGRRTSSEADCLPCVLPLMLCSVLLLDFCTDHRLHPASLSLLSPLRSPSLSSTASPLCCLFLILASLSSSGHADVATLAGHVAQRMHTGCACMRCNAFGSCLLSDGAASRAGHTPLKTGCRDGMPAAHSRLLGASALLLPPGAPPRPPHRRAMPPRKPFCCCCRAACWSCTRFMRSRKAVGMSCPSYDFTTSRTSGTCGTHSVEGSGTRG